MRWIEKDIVNMLATNGYTCKCSKSPGGDYDTPEILVTSPGQENAIWVRGFRPEKALSPSEWRDCQDIVAIEVNDGLDSRGGIKSSDPATILCYAHVLIKLREVGWDIIAHYDEIF